MTFTHIHTHTHTKPHIHSASTSWLSGPFIYFVCCYNQFQDVPRVFRHDSNGGTRYEICIVLRDTENKTKKQINSNVTVTNTGSSSPHIFPKRTVRKGVWKRNGASCNKLNATQKINMLTSQTLVLFSSLVWSLLTGKKTRELLPCSCLSGLLSLQISARCCCPPAYQSADQELDIPEKRKVTFIRGFRWLFTMNYHSVKGESQIIMKNNNPRWIKW